MGSQSRRSRFRSQAPPISSSALRGGVRMR